MDKNGMILVSECCNATVCRIGLRRVKDGYIAIWKCNTCDKECNVRTRKSSNAKEDK